VTEHSPALAVAVVDDDPSILRSLERLLESAGHSARAFSSGAALLASDCLSEIACLISDIDMPDMDGFELVRRVHEACPGLPTILITGYPETLKRLPLPIDCSPRVFIKPFAGEELLAAVGDALRGSFE
jgi:FixJ family two-component response regulator